jgi:hypothetical protein
MLVRKQVIVLSAGQHVIVTVKDARASRVARSSD